MKEQNAVLSLLLLTLLIFTHSYDADAFSVNGMTSGMLQHKEDMLACEKNCKPEVKPGKTNTRRSVGLMQFLFHPSVL